MSTAPLTPVPAEFSVLRIGDEIRGCRTDPDTGDQVEFAGWISDRSTHTLWISPAVGGPRLIVHDHDDHQIELVHPAPHARWSQPTAACPTWCATDSIDDEGGFSHVRTIGTMGVEISQTRDEPTMIFWPADNEVSTYPTADQAAQLGADLIEAARLLRGSEEHRAVEESSSSAVVEGVGEPAEDLARSQAVRGRWDGFLRARGILRP